MDGVSDEAAGTHRALGDPTRLEMCWLLAEKECSVTELVTELGISQPLASHHLRVLKDAGLAEGRRDSYWTRYRLLPGRIELLKDELEMLLASVSHRERAGKQGERKGRK